MQDPFTGSLTRIRGGSLPSADDCARIQDDHRRRLEAFDRLSACAAQCSVATDPDRDLITLPEDDLSLLDSGNDAWAQLSLAIKEWRRQVPLRRLEDFGFPGEAVNPLEEHNESLRRIGGGVEAWVFEDQLRSAYKFFLPGEGPDKRIGSSFSFETGDETRFFAKARPGTYRELFQKLLLISAIGGMPTEVIAVTPEGIVVTKQILGATLAQDYDVSQSLPAGLIEIPSRFLRADRDHPRLLFLDGIPFLVADLHSRNLVRDAEGTLRVIDLVGGTWPAAAFEDALIGGWLDKMRVDPKAPVLPPSPDDEL
jgi:hypothetical protein